MIKEINKNNRHNFFILVLSIVSLVLTNISGVIFVIFGFAIWLTIYLETKKSSNAEYTLIKMIMLSIPLSFINVLNGSYGKLPLSWFNIFVIGLIIIVFIKTSLRDIIKFDHIKLISLAMIVISSIILILSVPFSNALKQYVNIVLVFIIVIVGNIIKKRLTNEDKNNLLLYYLNGVQIASIGLILQILLINFFKIDIGYFSKFGSNRSAYAFLFSDYSFLSLYLSSGAIMSLLKGKKYFGSNLKWVCMFMLPMISSILTSARTGIVALLAVLLIYSFGKFFKLLLEGSIKSLIILLLDSLILLGSYFLLKIVRGGQLTSDSGRADLNNIAFSVFKQNPISGIGFGVTSYADKIGTIPHNLIYQFLAQGGLIFTLPLIVFLSMIVFKAYKNNRALLSGILVVILGSLFIPDIFNSRFLLAIVLLISTC